jgi:hypothetical protein
MLADDTDHAANEANFSSRDSSGVAVAPRGERCCRAVRFGTINGRAGYVRVPGPRRHPMCE